MDGPQRLYHCMNKDPEGDAIQPTCEREVNGRTGKFLFATPYISKAMAFSFDYHDKGEIICNGGIEGTRDEFAILCNRDVTLNAPRHIQLFSFSGEGFERIHPESSRQYVSERPVLFNQADCLFISHDVEDTMRYGLQIFSTTKTREQLLEENFFDQMNDVRSTEERLLNLVQNEGFVWENQARDIHPTPKLLNVFDGRSPRQALSPPPPSPSLSR